MIDHIDAANQAVFQFQYNTKDAVRYIMRQSSVDQEKAEKALNEVTTGYQRHSR
jgi:NACalpha-BTF3-like transcription factor